MVDAQASMGEVEYAEWGSAPNLARLAGRLLDQMARFEVRSQLIMPCGEAALAAGEGFPRARHQPMSGSARPPRGNSATGYGRRRRWATLVFPTLNHFGRRFNTEFEGPSMLI